MGCLLPGMRRTMPGRTVCAPSRSCLTQATLSSTAPTQVSVQCGQNRFLGLWVHWHKNARPATACQWVSLTGCDLDLQH